MNDELRVGRIRIVSDVSRYWINDMIGSRFEITSTKGPQIHIRWLSKPKRCAVSEGIHERVYITQLTQACESETVSKILSLYED